MEGKMVVIIEVGSYNTDLQKHATFEEQTCPGNKGLSPRTAGLEYAIPGDLFIVPRFPRDPLNEDLGSEPGGPILFAPDRTGNIQVLRYEGGGG